MEKASPQIAVRGYKEPRCLIHGTKDSVIDVKSAYMLKKANPKIKMGIGSVA